MTMDRPRSPEELVSAWVGNEITAGDAIAVILHYVDPTNIDSWVDPLPEDLREQFTEAARDRVRAEGKETYALGGGVGLEESSTAVQALRRWLFLRDPVY